MTDDSCVKAWFNGYINSKADPRAGVSMVLSHNNMPDNLSVLQNRKPAAL